MKPSQAALDAAHKALWNELCTVVAAPIYDACEQAVAKAIDRFAASCVEEWRSKLAEQCGKTLAAEHRLARAEEVPGSLIDPRSDKD